VFISGSKPVGQECTQVGSMISESNADVRGLIAVFAIYVIRSLSLNMLSSRVHVASNP
jgi:hypothetical protein